MSSATAHSFKPTENGPDILKSAQTFQCEPVWQSNNPVVASDPVRKVIVSIKFKDKSGVATELKVTPIGESDEKYALAGQYVQSNLTTRPGYRDYNWYGMQAKDPNFVMHRELFERDSSQYGKNSWFYIEEQFKYGEKDWEYRAVCYKKDPDAKPKNP